MPGNKSQESVIAIRTTQEIHTRLKIFIAQNNCTLSEGIQILLDSYVRTKAQEK